jgi:hypothetical protein
VGAVVEAAEVVAGEEAEVGREEAEGAAEAAEAEAEGRLR